MVGEDSASESRLGARTDEAEQPAGPSPEMRRQMEAARQRMNKSHAVYARPELGGPPSSAVSRSEER